MSSCRYPPPAVHPDVVVIVVFSAPAVVRCTSPPPSFTARRRPPPPTPATQEKVPPPRRRRPQPSATAVFRRRRCPPSSLHPPPPTRREVRNRTRVESGKHIMCATFGSENGMVPQRRYAPENSRLPANTPILGLGCSSFSTFFSIEDGVSLTVNTISREHSMVREWVETIR